MLYILRKWLNPPGIASMLDRARSLFRCISLINSGFLLAGLSTHPADCRTVSYLIISMDCLKKAGSLITWPSSGFCSTSAFICGLLIIMERTKSMFQNVIHSDKEYTACYNRTCVSHDILHKRRVHHLTHHFRIHIGHLHISKRRSSRR